MAGDPAKKKDEGSGLLSTLLVALGLGLLGAGGGGYLGYSIARDPTPPAKADEVHGGDRPVSDEAEPTGNEAHGKQQGEAKSTEGKSAGHEEKSGGAHGGGNGGGRGGGHAEKEPKATLTAPHARPIDFSVMTVKELPPIVTNLAKPETAWIRLQAAIVFDPKEFPHAEKLAPEIMSDITAYLRSLSIGALEGADGLRRLQEELEERVAIRSEHKVREFIIETMVVQ
jgi:flagellar FliL protein